MRLFWKDWGEITRYSFGKQRGKHKSSSGRRRPKKAWENEKENEQERNEEKTLDRLSRKHKSLM